MDDITRLNEALKNMLRFMAERDTLKAENARLREALTNIRDNGIRAKVSNFMRDIAAKALKRGSDGNKG